MADVPGVWKNGKKMDNGVLDVKENVKDGFIRVA
jgi:hypothetical protein